MEKLVNHLKATGYVFLGSEIYGGLANSLDYGPLGAILKRNIENLWIQEFITKEVNNFLVDTSIFMNDKIWESSGHIEKFCDPMIDCKDCNSRFRADKILEKHFKEKNISKNIPENNLNELNKLLKEHEIVCNSCGSKNLTEAKEFNLMFSLNDSKKNKIYLRPETAQGIFINFLNIARSQRLNLPFGVGQIGKSFRNEVTPGNFLFRMREFTQLELEIFCKESEENTIFGYYEKKIEKFLTSELGLLKNNIKKFPHPENKLAHYSKKTIDFEFKFSFGFGELWGLSNRGNYDLKVHEKGSNNSLKILDHKTHEKILPSIIEPSVGSDRLLLAILDQSFQEEKISEKNSRVVLKIPKNLCPYLACVMPLSKQLHDKAYEIYKSISKKFPITFDSTGNIGKRYRRQDAIGTYYCITIDFDTENNNSVTIRNRDSMKQDIVRITEIEKFIKNNEN